MSNYYLKCSFSELSEMIQQQILKAEKIQNFFIDSDEALENAKKEKRSWVIETGNMLKEAFVDSENEMVDEFRNSAAHSGGYIIPNAQRSVSKEIEDFKSSIKAYIDGLHSFLEDAELSDIMSDPNSVVIEQRKRFTVEEKEFFLLNKLSKKNNGNFFDIKRILESNGVEFNHYDEPLELINDLENAGMIESMKRFDGAYAKITIQGLKYLEQNRSKLKEGENKVSEAEYEAMSSKIDEMIEALKKAGVEREILFDEMQELKELYTKLNKKNWKQIVLGKLADMALGKIIEPDTMSSIYHRLTGDLLPKLMG